MKRILTLVFSGLILSIYSFANTPILDQSAAGMKEKYTDELKIKD